MKTCFIEGRSNGAGNILQLFKETKKIMEREDDESSFDNGDFVWDEIMFYRYPEPRIFNTTEDKKWNILVWGNCILL